ncbi:type I-E CRISPR-associated protein Cas5/CasD [Nocardia sp. NPDC050435]|uniref:type I-E CRISPR-associated protein Cas5/CasD n=1 Tax=Nocardia sp. NPDC050435 TaxID=3155040 RepID=UPI0033CC61DE
MSVLLLRLAAPLQSWGVASRYARRDTQQYPSKSGVLGLIAAARGQRRTAQIEEALTGLAFGVRIDQQGTLVRDFQVALSLDKKKSFPLSERYYLADAVFVAAVAGERNMLEGIATALSRPEFPLYLGRRSCPVTESLVLGQIVETDLATALADTAWQASSWYRRRQPGRVYLPIYRDQIPGDQPEPFAEQVQDVPIDFNPVRREYGWRTVIADRTTVENPDGRLDTHDPFAALGGA